MPTLSLPDITLQYEITGDGPPLLLLPGMLSDNASWAPLIPLLSGRFTLILPDPRGAGRTVPWDAPLTLQALAGDMLALLDHLGHARAHVAGHSMGGLVALTLAGRAPGRVASVTCMASTPLPSARIPAIFAALTEARRAGPEGLWLRQLFPWLFHDRFFRDPQAVEDAVAASLAYPHLQSAEAMAHQTRALGRLDIASLPQAVTVPGLALLAEEDALIPPGPAGRALERMGLTVRTLPKAGHSLHWDAPEAVAGALADFIGGLA